MIGCGESSNLVRSMPCGLIGVEIGAEQRLSIAAKACVAAVDEILVTVQRERLQIETAGQDRLDSAIKRRGVRKGTLAGGLEPAAAVGVGEPQNALCAAQSLHDTIAEQVLDERRATGADAGRLLQAPVSIIGEEGARFRRHVIRARTPAAGTTAAQMAGHLSIVLEDRDRQIGGTQPQRVAQPILMAEKRVPTGKSGSGSG